jgi:prepilin signal peptidase PulO-like enzyme (type II secretory pathway)
MDPITYWTLRLGWILVAWLFTLGGVVGSFLNVVVYRLPRGKSIVHPGSACPACGHLIRWYDNLPIVSWVILGGRCRDCRAKISARYPLVELAVAMLFAGVFLIAARPEIVAIADGKAGREASGWLVLVHYVADLWLLSTLFCAALIEFDGLRVPRRLFLVALLIAITSAAVIAKSRTHDAEPIVGAFVGLVAGCAIGWLFDFAGANEIDGLGHRRHTRHASANRSATFPLACVGAFWGRMPALAIGAMAAITIAILWVRRKDKTTPTRLGWSGAALIGTLWFGALTWIVYGAPFVAFLMRDA